MKEINVIWTGHFPCTCHGEWRLYVNGEDHSDLIPVELLYSPMETYGEYSRWEFDENYLEVWEKYFDGLKMEEWIKANQYWLADITTDHEIQKELFKAFQAQDWRHGCCGGCI